MKIGFAVLASIFCLVSTTAFAHEGEHLHESHRHKHMQYAKEKNPIPMNEQSIMKGKELYGKHCLRCHGEGRKTGGNLDLTKAVFNHGTSDGEIFRVITDGVKGTAMRTFKKDLTKDCAGTSSITGVDCGVYYRLSKREEREMIELFREEYRGYIEKTPMFMPGLGGKADL